MIQNDQEFKTTQERVAYFQKILLQIRQTANPQEFYLVASGYLAEIEKMEKDMHDYLAKHATELIAA